jgi:hypothetical protein
MKLDKKHIESLIEKYFEGLTSLEEERLLRKYFQEEEIAEEWEIYKPLFQFFSSEIEQVQKERNGIGNGKVKIIHWFGIAAAACLLLFFGLKFASGTQRTLPETSQAYIDGKKYTDIELIQIEALKTLENLSEGNDDILSSQIEALNLLFEQ